MEWSSNKIRQTFFDFFNSKDHEIVASAPMVVKNDPTLMFINAGMNQFKDTFLGNAKPSNSRVANAQKCLRVSGKHNDLEEVGVDTYHHTMFEMLGNWSFGDYFKKEAIHWAWELLTEVYKIDKSRLYITIFEGDASDGLEEDSEALNYWKEIVPENRILKCNKKDNFWEMGETGPCGPCSEIHVDLRSQEEIDKIQGADLVNKDHPQVIEIWNLVFIQYNRKKDKSLNPLPLKHVDTGMGLERLAMVLQHQKSNYDTDVFSGLINQLEKISGVEYQKSNSKKDIALRVISDHIRAVSFSIADGQLPSNTGAGYVIRRILRRAIRYGYSFLNLDKPFIHGLVSYLVEKLGDSYPELKAQQNLIENVIKEEEESFLRTMEKGLGRLEKLTSGKSDLDGKSIFELFDTYGFPLDLTTLILSEKEIQADVEGFNVELAKQKDRSRKASVQQTDDWVIISKGTSTEFLGYDTLESKIEILRHRKVTEKNNNFYQLIFNRTPFYPEGGGQVGDTGFIESNSEKIEIVDTKKENDLIIHYSTELPTNIEAEYNAIVNSEKRYNTQLNHSATHLMHHALRKVLGTHVEQKGSLVNQDYLRFDFSHFAKLSKEEILQVEKLVNKEIRMAIPLHEKRKMPITEAKEMGAMALFGEKYGNEVRVVKFGDSVELCGGTHAQNTANIGNFKITSESGIAAGIRRIEAVTGDKADAFYQDKLNLFDEVSTLLKNPTDLQKSISSLLEENASMKRKLESFQKQNENQLESQLINEAKEINGINLIVKELDLEAGSIKNLAFQLKKKVDNLLFVAGSKANGKALLTVALSDNLVSEKGLNASTMIRELAKEIQGGGGGQPFFATAGGKNPDGITRALEKVKELI